LVIDPSRVQTNIVIFSVTRPHLDPQVLCHSLANAGVLAAAFGPGRVRLVTHADIDDSDVECALRALAAALRQ
jgi:threonine aldolase